MKLIINSRAVLTRFIPCYRSYATIGLNFKLNWCGRMLYEGGCNKTLINKKKSSTITSKNSPDCDAKNLDIMEPRDFIPPLSYDVLLNDVKHNDLIGPVAERLGIEYLSEQSDVPCQKVVEGILYGTNCRPMVNLVVSSKKHRKNINVIFLVDSGSPCLYLCQPAMEALGFSDHIPKTFSMVFNGTVYEAVMSPLVLEDGKGGHFSELNLIGATFLSKSKAKLLIDYSENAVTLNF